VHLLAFLKGAFIAILPLWVITILIYFYWWIRTEAERRRLRRLQKKVMKMNPKKRLWCG
jgi:hypothetical protein